MEKIFEGMPKSFWVTTFIFMYLFFYLFYVHLRGTQLNTFEFYTISLIPILIAVGVRGSKFFDDFGFNLGVKGTKWYIEIGRLLILSVIGFLIGFGMYELDKMSFSIVGYHLLPMDTYMIQYTISNQAFQTFVDVLIIAVFEEIIRAVGFMGYSNWFYSKGIDKNSSVIYGIILAGFMFILLHYFSWGGLNLISMGVGVASVSLMSFAGYTLRERKIFGKLGFYEWTIYAPIIAHLVFDFMTFMRLSIFI